MRTKLVIMAGALATQVLPCVAHAEEHSSGFYVAPMVTAVRRAEAVRQYLLGKHVTNGLTARGYGESEPVADNATEEGRARNRRVVLRILTR